MGCEAEGVAVVLVVCVRGRGRQRASGSACSGHLVAVRSFVVVIEFVIDGSVDAVCVGGE